MTTKTSPEHRARVLDADDADDHAVLTQLFADRGIDVIDTVNQQLRSLDGLLPPPAPAGSSEPTRWAYYPWRRAVVAILGPSAYRRARLDRNRNLISTEEQDRLASLRVGIVGLSVGHALAHTVALQGLCGTLRLADFDGLELHNLNRVPATVFDLGINKAIVAARRIAEADPYFPVEVMTDGLNPQSVDEFINGLDVVVEECDSLEIKTLVREAARTHQLPVLMATSDRGLLDVERFDLQPGRPLFHGLLGDVNDADLARLSTDDKVPHVLRLLDPAALSARGAASLLEVGHTLSTWPQLAGDVAVGAGAVAEAIRRIGLGEDLPSGRVRIDVATALQNLNDPSAPPVSPHSPEPAAAPPTPIPHTTAESIAAAAIRAPSGGNAQPWHVEVTDSSVTLHLAPERTSSMDVGFRASAVAIGAAVFNARVAAAAHGVLGAVTMSERANRSPLYARLTLGADDDPGLARQLEPMLARETNRHRGAARALESSTATRLISAASSQGARLRLLTETEDIDACARILGESDRIRYLTPKLHAEMISELRRPRDPFPDSGIDVQSLELDEAQRAAIDILRRADVMAELASWHGGAGLAADTRTRIAGCSAVAVVCAHGHALLDYAKGGSAMEAVWVEAHEQEIAVQPASPVFLYAQSRAELISLSPAYANQLSSLREEFIELVGLSPEESAVLVLRLFDGPPPSVRSRRRPLRTALHANAQYSSSELPFP